MSVRREIPSDRAFRDTLKRRLLASASMSQLMRMFEKAIKEATLGTVLLAFSEVTRRQARSGGEGVSAVQVSRIADQLTGMARSVQGTSRRARRVSGVELRADPRQLRVRVSLSSIRSGKDGEYVVRGHILEELLGDVEFSAVIEKTRLGNQEFYASSFKSSREPAWLFNRFLDWALNDDFEGVREVLELENRVRRYGNFKRIDTGHPRGDAIVEALSKLKQQYTRLSRGDPERSKVEADWRKLFRQISRLPATVGRQVQDYVQAWKLDID